MKPVDILLVDDDASIRRIMRIVLSIEPGVGQVREAGDGGDAVDVCKDFQPDVVLLDYWMPEMDGGAAAIRIRAMHPAARIVAYSAVLDKRPDWADAYLKKDDLPDPRFLVELGQSGSSPLGTT